MVTGKLGERRDGVGGVIVGVRCGGVDRGRSEGVEE